MREKKINFIRSIISHSNPDIIYLIDINKEIIISPSLENFYDGRNALFVRKDIIINIKSEENLFISDIGIIFSYYPPNKNIDFANKLINYINDNYIIIGDMNLHSNNKLKEFIISNKIKIVGEESLQTIMIYKNENDYVAHQLKYAPSDHMLLLLKIIRKFKAKSFYSIKLNFDYKFNLINAILSGNNKIWRKPKINIEEKKILVKKSFFGSIINLAINSFMHNNSHGIYSIFNIMPNNISNKFINLNNKDELISEWKEYMNHKDNKEYFTITEFITTFPQDKYDELFNLLNTPVKNGKYSLTKNEKIEKLITYKYLEIHRSKSLAINSDAIPLHLISEILLKYIKDTLKDNEIDKALEIIQQILNNIFKYVNNLVKNNTMEEGESFLLLKSKQDKLNRANTRLIFISPAIMQMYEALTFRQIDKELTELLKSWSNKIFAGIADGSTFSMIHALIKYVNDKNIKGFYKIDIAAGYDNINLNLLNQMISEEENLSQRTKVLIRNWIILVKDIDLWIGGNLVKQNKGIAMGYVYSPIIFVYYINKLLKEISFYYNDIFSYIDDLVILIHNSDNIINKLKIITETLKTGGLSIKIKKSQIIINQIDKNEIAQIKKKFDINITDKTVILGREIMLYKSMILPDNQEYIQIINQEIRTLPNFLPLKIKKILYNGKYLAKTRFLGLMIAITDKKMVQQILKKTWLFFKIGNNKFSYKQVIIISWNIFRLCINAYTFEIIEFKVAEKLVEYYKLNALNSEYSKEITIFLTYNNNKNLKIYLYNVLIIAKDKSRRILGYGTKKEYLDDAYAGALIAIAQILNLSLEYSATRIRIITKSSVINKKLMPLKADSVCKSQFDKAIDEFNNSHRNIKIVIQMDNANSIIKNLDHQIYEKIREYKSNKKTLEEDIYFKDILNQEDLDKDINQNKKNLFLLYRKTTNDLFKDNFVAIYRNGINLIRDRNTQRIDNYIKKEWEIISEELNAFIKEKIYTNIESIDKLIKKINIQLDSSIFNLFKDNYIWKQSWYGAKLLSDQIWNKLREQITIDLAENKYSNNKNINWFKLHILINKIGIADNYLWINQLLFGHIENINSKQIALIKFYEDIINDIWTLFFNKKFDKLNKINIIQLIGNKKINKEKEKIFNIEKKISNYKALNLFDKYIELFEINNQIIFIPLTEKIKFYVDLIEKNKAASTLVQAYKIKIKELSNKENIKEYLSSYTANIDKLDIISIKNTYPWKINNETIKPSQKIKHIEYINRMMKFLNFTIDSLWNKNPDKNIDIITWIWEYTIAYKTDWENLDKMANIFDSYAGLDYNDQDYFKESLIDINIGNDYEDE